MGYWPAGLCLCFPGQGSVNGQLVLMPGDANLTFKRYIETAVVLTVRDDYVVDVGGNGLDAELMRSYFEAWGERDAYAVSHVGWGMNPAARWDSLVMYDRGDVNCTEQRAFAGNFLYSTGANETVGRFSACHFDIPMRRCTVALDDTIVVADGVVQGELAM
jgi:2,5-dihydroxypyridine 5,6-dioxygenase